MDLNVFSAVAHANHHFSSPLSVETLDRVLAVSGIQRRWRVTDLGCGPGAMALHLAERYGAEVQAVDRSQVMLDLAKGRAEGRGAPGSISFHLAQSADYLREAEPCDLLMAIGAGALVPGAADNAAQLAALGEGVRPGGRVLWGETFWKKPPSERLLALSGPVAALYAGHGDYVAAGESAGLTPLYAAVSSDQEWDEYAWRYSTAVESFIVGQPPGEATEAMRARIRAFRAIYLGEGRETMGFGLYLFAKT